MKSLFLSIICVLLICNTATADGTAEAEKLIKEKLGAVITVLQNNSLDKKNKNAKVLDIVTPAFDFSLMAKLTLGKTYWPAFTGEQKKEFTDLFIEKLKKSYLEKLNLYTNERIAYKAPIQAKSKVHVPTELISKDNVITMLYKLYKSKNGWRIYDIEIQGVSIISTYRSQFDQVLSSGTPDDLLKKLKQNNT